MLRPTVATGLEGHINKTPNIIFLIRTSIPNVLIPVALREIGNVDHILKLTIVSGCQPRDVATSLISACHFLYVPKYGVFIYLSYWVLHTPKRAVLSLVAF